MSKDGFPFAPAAQIPRLMKPFENEHLGTYTPCTNFDRPQLTQAIAVTHVEFILMHQSREGNGRISRLLADVMAMQAGNGPSGFCRWETHKKTGRAAGRERGVKYGEVRGGG